MVLITSVRLCQYIPEVIVILLPEGGASLKLVYQK